MSDRSTDSWVDSIDMSDIFNDYVDDTTTTDPFDDVDMSSMFEDWDQNLALVYQPPNKRHYNSKKSTVVERRQPTVKLAHGSRFENVQNEQCCSQQCLQLLSLSQLKRIRLPFITKNERERSDWLLDVLRASSINKGDALKIVYKLDGHVVCRTAFTKALGISTKKLSSVVNLVKTQAVVIVPHGNSLRQYKTPQRDKVEAFILGLTNVFFDEQPDSDEWHCPIILNKKLLYEELLEQNTHNPPSKQVFYSTIQHYQWIKFPKNTRLGKCDECVKLRIELNRAKRETAVLVQLIKQKLRDHNTLQKLERLTYDTRKTFDATILWQTIWDGYSGVLIPHISWPNFPKSWLRLPRLRLQVSGVINHNLGVKELYVSIAQQFDHDSNYSMNLLAIHISKQLANGHSLPSKLVFQSDNCWRENKNIFVLGFFAVILLKNLTKDIYFICLLQGHTHTDIDQQNVPFAKGLKSYDLKTGAIEDVQHYVDNCYEEQPPSIHYVSTIWDLKSWIAPYLPKLQGHTKPHVFWLTRNGNGHVVMRWRDFTSTDEQWQGGEDGEPITILTGLPDGQPQPVKPHKIEDNIISATRRTYDKLSEEEQQYYEHLFQGRQVEDDDTALRFLSVQLEQPSTVDSPLSFLPKQKQVKWKSTTKVTVLTKAAVINNPIQTNIQLDEDDIDDYDAPIIMQPSSETAWTAKQFRGLTTANYGRSQRQRSVQNYAEKLNNNTNDE